MTKSTKKIIRIVVLLATFIALEFAAPVSVHASRGDSDSKFIASRTPFAELIACKELIRKPYVVVQPEPTYSIARSFRMTITAYSSTPDQTFGDPFITANGSRVHWGTFAVNGLPFGTKLRIPDYFGDTIFTVEDRMASRYSSNRGDIWMETRAQAKQWGVRSVRVEIVSLQ